MMTVVSLIKMAVNFQVFAEKYELIIRIVFPVDFPLIDKSVDQLLISALIVSVIIIINSMPTPFLNTF